MVDSRRLEMEPVYGLYMPLGRVFREGRLLPRLNQHVKLKFERKLDGRESLMAASSAYLYRPRFSSIDGLSHADTACLFYCLYLKPHSVRANNVLHIYIFW